MSRGACCSGSGRFDYDSPIERLSDAETTDRALLEREGEVEAIAEAIGSVAGGDVGRALLIEGPAGIGKTALMGELRGRAREGGLRVLGARGSEMEREFGFGIVRQLFGPVLRGLSADGRAALFTGPAALAAAIFGMADVDGADVGAEASLYGLFWMVATLAEGGPLVLAIDDAHWADAGSLRFVQYLGRRLDEVPVLLALAARPNEPGVEAEMLRGLTASLEVPAVRPQLLSEEGTATLVRGRLGPEGEGIAVACHRATGGNPLLIKELLADLDLGTGPASAATVAEMGPERIGIEVTERAARLDPHGPDIVRAVALLGEGADLITIAALAEVEPAAAERIVDQLAAASILVHSDGHGFVHPLLRRSVYEGIPAAGRARAHARAAELLADRHAEAEEVAAHLLLCEPGSARLDALALLDRAATSAAGRGAPESVVAYLRRALPEVGDDEARGELLRRLGHAEVSLRDPASIEHLAQAAALATDPAEAIGITLELIELLSVAGQWEAAVGALEGALARWGDTQLPGVLDLEAALAASRAYDPARVADYDRDLPRLEALVEGRRDEESLHLRWILAVIGALRDSPRPAVLGLLEPAPRRWSMRRGGRESTFIGQPLSALFLIDAEEEAMRLAGDLLDEGRRGGSLMAMVVGVGYVGTIDSRHGRLASAEAQLLTAIDLARQNEISLMALTTLLCFGLETIVERAGLAEVADLIEGLELPEPFAATHSGAMLGEVRGAVRAARGDRAGAVADLREVAAISIPLRAGPRMSRWRSRLAAVLPEEGRDEALALAAEELELARAINYREGEGVALRALGMVRGGEAGIETLRESVTALGEESSPLERARSRAELGAALRRAGQRSEAREWLREAATLAQRCGAEQLEEAVLEELTIAGAKPRRRALSGADSLTPGERRVARAAAAGATNREIAQELFVSLRAVEMHLTNAYRKLGISSRAELTTALAANT
jgi:DNA-binding CsgD family transcriptional regulator